MADLCTGMAEISRREGPRRERHSEFAGMEGTEFERQMGGHSGKTKGPINLACMQSCVARTFHKVNSPFHP